jgi:hypothetical protein
MLKRFYQLKNHYVKQNTKKTHLRLSYFPIQVEKEFASALEANLKKCVVYTKLKGF